MEHDQRQKKTYGRQESKLKAEAYCAYQERAQQEVRDKLYDYGLHMEDVEQIISELIVDNFLNEERFANAYALGKFRIKGWGKLKIKQGLKFKRVPDKMIQTALKQIPYDDYAERLEKTIANKVPNAEKLKVITEKAKLIRFLQSRGFENELIFEKVQAYIQNGWGMPYFSNSTALYFVAINAVRKLKQTLECLTA